VSVEKALIGEMLMGAEPDIAAEDFIEYRSLAEAILRLRAAGSPVDASTVAHEAGGHHREILACQDAAVTSVHAEEHAKRVRDDASRRRVIAACELAASLAKTNDEGWRAAAENVPDVASTRHHAEHIGELLLARIGTLSTARHYVWLQDFPKMHLHPGDFIVVGARPKVGKSAFGAQLAQEFAGRHLKTRVYSLEMSAGDWADRFLMRMTPFTTNDFDKGLTPEAIAMVEGSMQDSLTMPLDIIDDAGLTCPQLVSDMRRYARKGGKVVIVDYLQLLVKRDRGMSRYDAVTDISGMLKVAARQTGLIVIALAQLNRGVVNESGKIRRPGLSDLRESGALEQDADAIILLHRYALDDEDARSGLKKLHYIIEGDEADGGSGKLSLVDFAGMRRGDTRSFPCMFFGTDQTFTPLEKWDAR
jgi:replicative DNA helicase